ncbi:recombinase family protein [Kribbella orskensis]|uniref:recombinase family protein n=1 Tax=Kribbella orskensis TaxID=2512216 RepID=UPI001F53F8FE|nr:recombinase family protein [Kribbella orskensis]
MRLHALPGQQDHDRDPDRLRPLLHRQTRPHRPAPSPARARRRRRTDLPRPRPHRHQPRPPGLDQALAAVRPGDTLVVPKLDRLARSVPDARDIGDSLAARGVRRVDDCEPDALHVALIGGKEARALWDPVSTTTPTPRTPSPATDASVGALPATTSLSSPWSPAITAP